MAGEQSSELSEEEYIQEIIEAARGPIKTSQPGRVVSYDPETQTAVVQPLIPVYKVDWEGETEGFEQLSPARMPVAFPGSGEVSLHFYLEEGTDGIIVICDRDTKGWEATASAKSEPPTRSRFDHRHALFIPEVRSPSTPRDPEYWDSPDQGPVFHLKENQAFRFAKATADKALAMAEKVAARLEDFKVQFNDHNHVPPNATIVDPQSGTTVPVVYVNFTTGPPLTPGLSLAVFPDTQPEDLETERVKVDK